MNNQNNTNNVNIIDNDNNDKKKNKKIKTAAVVSGVLIIFLLITNLLSFFGTKEDNEKKYTEFWAQVEAGQVETVKYDSYSDYLLYTIKDDKTEYKTDNPKAATFKRELLEKDIEVEEVEFSSGFMSYLSNILLLIIQYGLMMGMFLIIFKKISGGEETMKIETSSTNTFADVAGLDEVKESMLTTVDMLKNPDKYAKAGARISKGILLYGPPGTGKTLLAKAIAGEAGTNFLAINGADIEHKYVGVGADKVRKIFERAKKLAPCIVFIDELDAVGCKRTDSDKSYERQTLNQLLGCMDGFSASDGVFVFAATNNIESLDPALLRPGRFDSRFAVGLPDTAKDRAAIINLYLKNKKIDDTVSVDSIAKQTLGCSPAMIEAIINEAAIESVKNNGVINQENIDEAFYRQLMDGHKKKTSDRDKDEIKTVAWHEAGHAVVGYFTNEEVTKISIIPTTSGAGGVTIFNQKKLGLYSKEELENHVKTLYAGRNAEILLNGEAKVTTGASNDIKEATKCIKGMVDVYGMSDYGPLDLTQFNISSDELFKEYTKISAKLSNESMNILNGHRDLLEQLAQTLIEKETIGEEELKTIFNSQRVSTEA